MALQDKFSRAQQMVVCCGALVLFVLFHQTTKESSIKEPVLFTNIVGSLMCFICAYTWLTVGSYYYVVASWTPTETKQQQGLLWVLAGTMAIQLVSGRMARVCAGNLLAGWGTDAWMSTVLMFVGLFSFGQISTKNISISIAYSLEMVCGCVLMLPFESFNTNFAANFWGLIQSMCTAATCVIAHQILTKPKYSNHLQLSPITLCMHVSLLIPLLLIVPALYLESDLIFSWRTSFFHFLSSVSRESMFMCGSTISSFQLLQNSLPFLTGVLWCLGITLATVIQVQYTAIWGFAIVSFCFVSYCYILLKDTKHDVSRIGPLELNWL